LRRKTEKRRTRSTYYEKKKRKKKEKRTREWGKIDKRDSWEMTMTKTRHVWGARGETLQRIRGYVKERRRRLGKNIKMEDRRKKKKRRKGQ